MLCLSYFSWHQAEITDIWANTSNENSSLLSTLKKVLESYLTSVFLDACFKKSKEDSWI